MQSEYNDKQGGRFLYWLRLLSGWPNSRRFVDRISQHQWSQQRVSRLELGGKLFEKLRIQTPFGRDVAERAGMHICCNQGASAVVHDDDNAIQIVDRLVI